MPQTTPKLGMTTYDLVNDGSVYFSTFRTTLAGYTNSALTKIDDFATQISADVNLLKSNPPIVRISAIKTDDFSYAVTGITEVTAYNNGMYINLSLDNTNIGTVSLNINNLGAKGVYKIGADGLVANMSAGDLRKNKMQLFRYNGTAWVWVNAITSDQLNIVGAVGNLTKISSDNTLEDSGVTFATTATNNTIAQRTATGQIKGVTPSANDDLANKQYVDTKAPLASPTLTGTPTAPTATVGTNTTQVATTAFVNTEISNDRPYATTTTSLTNGGTGIVGTSSNVAREDHTHTLPQSVLQSQVINDLTTGGETNVLSAEQGKVLNVSIANTNVKIDNFHYNNAGAHNSIYRGKFLGTSVTTVQYSAISSGTFDDLYIGDYWIIGGVNYRIAGFNYFYNVGDTALTQNHVTIVPDTQLGTARMNPTNDTTGGYALSEMRTTNLATATATIESAFAGHIITHRQILTNAVTTGKASGWAWFNCKVELMSEVMLYGLVAWGEATYNSGYNVGSTNGQLPLFALRRDLINNRQDYWLRDVVSATRFAFAYYYGNANSYDSSYSYGVRPAFSIS